MRSLTLAFLLSALALGSLSAQSSTAWTSCRGQDVQTFVNVGVLGTDSTEEILHHEEVHRAQARALIDSLGACPNVTQRQALNIEAGAYCASDSVRVRVKHTPKYEASAITLYRLLGEFWPSIPADTVVTVWRATCP